VLEIYEKLYIQYLNDKKAIPSENLFEMKYEEFVKDPMRYLSQIYSDLDIEGFEEQKETFKDYIDAQAGYKTNGYKIDIVNKKKLNKRLFFLFNKFGYKMEA